MSHLLEVNHLQIELGEKAVVDDISFWIDLGEVVGIVGESGSGKSMTALSLMKLLPEEAIMHGEEILFQGKEKQLVPGEDVAMIFQEPMTSLNPVLTIGRQVSEMLHLHSTLTKHQIEERVKEMFVKTDLPDTEEFLKKYPHELSGGMRQRVMIAMAMICRPKLLIADEPTTALDAEVQEDILQLIQKLSEDFKTAVLFISHDIHLVHRFCHHVLVMNQGKIVEYGESQKVFSHPQEAYTKALLEALPSIEKKQDSKVEEKPVLQVENLTVSYGEQTVLEDINFSLKKGETLGIMGASGCGKSTLSQAVAGLIRTDAGTIRCEGRVGMVFQDPYSSLNPAKKIRFILEEPLRIQKVKKVERQRRIEEIIYEVGLAKEYLERRVSELSGGQRQRVAIACALMSNPEVLILDEPVSALDVTVQDIICRLLIKCKKTFGLSYLFISHDKAVIDMMCDRVLNLERSKQ